MNFYDIFESYGFLHFIGPFLIIFSLIYGSLRKIGIFGNVRNAEKSYIVISIVIAFYYLYNISTVEYTQKVLSFFFYEILTLLFILLILGLIFNSLRSRERGTPRPTILAGILSLSVIFAFLHASVSYPESISSTIAGLFDFIVATGLFIVLAILAIVIIVVIWVTSPGTSGPKEKAKNILITTDSTLEDMIRKLSGR